MEIRRAMNKKSLYSIRLKVLPWNKDLLRKLAEDVIKQFETEKRKPNLSFDALVKVYGMNFDNVVKTQKVKSLILSEEEYATLMMWIYGWKK